MAALDEDIAKVLFSRERIEERIEALGDELNTHYEGRPLTLVVILKGAFIFCADLLRKLDLDVNVGFMVVSSYGSSMQTSGTVRIVKDLQRNIEDEDVLLVEDIVDTGLTISYLRRLLGTRSPRSLKVCSLLSKPSCRVVDAPVDYLGFEIPNEFVVGYGLDYDQCYRQLPYIGVLKPSAVEAKRSSSPSELYSESEHSSSPEGELLAKREGELS